MKIYVQCKPCHLAEKDNFKRGVGTNRGDDPKNKGMKRQTNLYSKIVTIENLRLADARARKGKGNQYGVRIFDNNPEGNFLLLHEMLTNNAYKTSEYSTFKVYEPKERLVYRLPYFPDRICHHAIMNVLEPIFMANFTSDTYSCIKGRGVHACSNAVKKALQDVEGTKYCLKLDITKFYPSIDHDILKSLLRKKFKDQDLLALLYEIIDSAPGLPIGNYLSQYLANFYLSYFDHWMKEEKGVKYYFRYADDIVALASSKTYLHQLFIEMNNYINDRLNLQFKGNHQVFPVNSRGIDFVGYVHYHTHTLLRKSIKKRFAKSVSKKKKHASIAAYWGWAKHADSKNLLKKLLTHEQFQRFQH
ncbi:Retron-type reverse transcriptase [Galbibacter marinus]|uniref:Retron-type reverse transcriptase n=2 Tax=Galbibacter marinus TaxID=555500 RepID=K2P5F5_9FLAO|nr:Retron-type reverse transcriptase [Galbibacter marinus]